MKQTKLQQARQQFREINKSICASRDKLFADQAWNMWNTLQQNRDNPDTLKDLARKLLDRGYYSSTISVGVVEQLLLSRLRAELGETYKAGPAGWRQFIREVAPYRL